MSEFSDLFGEWMTHGVSVRSRTGTGGHGPIFGAPQAFPDLMVEESRKTVTQSDGTMQVSEAQIYVENPAELAAFTDRSEVILPSGRVAVVIMVKHLDVYGLFNYGTVYTS